MSTLDLLVPYALAIILIWSAALNIKGPDFIRAEFAKWHYAPWFRFVVGAAELTSAFLLLVPGLRPYGAALMLAILIGVLFSFTKSREWMRMDFPLVLSVLCIGLIV